MSKSMKFKSVIVAMTLSVFLLAAASAQDQSADKAQPPQEKPSTDSVLVEAYLVEVSNVALAASGTAILPGDGKKESVSITKLLWCMKDPNGGKVVSMARAFCRTNETANNAAAGTKYIKQIMTQPGAVPQSIQYVGYNAKSELSVRPYISANDDSSMFLELKFVYEGFTERGVDEDGQAPPGKLAYSFNSRLVIKPHQPMIVGSMQSGDSSLFLVVRAEIVK